MRWTYKQILALAATDELTIDDACGVLYLGDTEIGVPGEDTGICAAQITDEGRKIRTLYQTDEWYNPTGSELTLRVTILI